MGLGRMQGRCSSEPIKLSRTQKIIFGLFFTPIILVFVTMFIIAILVGLGY